MTVNAVSTSQVLIIGCGFVGRAFAASRLAARDAVTVTTRSGAVWPVLAGASAFAFDGVSGVAELADAWRAADAVLLCAPPTDAGDPALVALADVIASGASSLRPRWLGYLSTTGVYGDRQGGWAFEDDVASPASPEAKRRALAERQARALGGHVFRLPGIYGPGRSALDQVRAGTARRIVKPGQVFSRAHRDDIVAALNASLARPSPGRVYNICDERPCPSADVTVHAARLLGMEPPPEVLFDASDLSPAGRRFYAESKRVSNARAKAELGWRPAFPTYLEGLADCLARTG